MTLLTLNTNAPYTLDMPGRNQAARQPRRWWDDFRNARESLDFSRQDLAQLLGVHQTAIYQWERCISPPDPRHWAKFMATLGLTAEQIARHVASFSMPNLSSDYSEKNSETNITASD